MVTHRNALHTGHKLHWYEIVSILGQGGFGITYLANDPMDLLVAIKEFLPMELAVRESDSSLHPVSDGHSDTYGWGLDRFLSEAQTLARFRHPNIVRVLSVFEANNTAYMVMEYEQGKSLEDALKFRRIEGEEQLLGLLFPLLDGLELVHAAGFIHRDIKPDNIYMREDGVPVLLDFGSARQALGVATRTLTTLVSPGYAPFEQYNATRDSDRQGPWTDIYSLGATLYRAVSGKVPPDAIARANAALEGKDDPLVPAISLSGDGYTRVFLEAIDGSLSFLPEKRPQTVEDWRLMFPRTDTPTVTGGRLVESATGTNLSEAPTMVNEQGVTGSGSKRPAMSSAKRWVVAALVVLVVLGAGLGGYVLRPAREAAVETQTPSAIQIPSEGQVVEVEPAPLETEPETPGPSSALDASQEQLSSLTKQLSELEAEREESPAAAEESPISVVTDLDTPDQDVLADLAAESVLRQQEEDAERRQQEEQARLQEEAKRLQDEIERQAEIERQKAQLLAAQREQEELERKALEEQMAREVKRQTEETERKAETERKRAQVLEAELAALAALAAARQQQARVDELLALAEVDLAASRLTTPSGNNALERYREVLDLDKGNAVALEGLERIVVRYVQLAEQATARGNFASARSFLGRAEQVLPDSLLLLEAAQAIERAQAQATERRVLAEAERKERQDAEKRKREEAEALASQEEELERIQQELARLKAEAELKERLKQQQAASETSVERHPRARGHRRQTLESVASGDFSHADQPCLLLSPGVRVAPGSGPIDPKRAAFDTQLLLLFGQCPGLGSGGTQTALDWQRHLEEAKFRAGVPCRREYENRWGVHVSDEVWSQRRTQRFIVPVRCMVG